MYIGDNRKRQAAAHLFQDCESFFDAETSKALAAGTIGLVKRGFIDKRNIQLLANLLQFGCGIERHLLGFDDAWTGHQKQRLVETNLEIAEFHCE